MHFIHFLGVLISSAAICYGIEDSLQNVTTQMLSMPLQDDINAPLVAHIDVNSLNKELKAFIQQEVITGCPQVFSSGCTCTLYLHFWGYIQIVGGAMYPLTLHLGVQRK